MRSADGKQGVGQNLKKSPVEAPNDRIRGRERVERKATPLPYVGPSWADSSASIPFQLENNFGNCRNHLVDLLLPVVSRDNPKPAGSGIPHASDAPYSRRSPRNLGRPSQPSQSYRSGLCEPSGGRIEIEFLPAYAPELNPVEYIWGHWKQHEIPNFCPKDLVQLSQQARKALRRMRRRPTLVTAFWKQAKLF